MSDMLRVEEARETVRPIDHLHVQGLFIVGWASVCVVTRPRWSRSSAGTTTSCTAKGVFAVLGSTEVVMPVCTTSFISGLESHVPLGQDELLELWHVLSTVPDPRDPRGVRHPISVIVVLAIGAVLAGCRSVDELRGVMFAEDRSTLRTGRAPAVMAMLRNTTISIPRLAGRDNIAAIARHPERVLDLVDRPPHPRTSRDGRP